MLTALAGRPCSCTSLLLPWTTVRSLQGCLPTITSATHSARSRTRRACPLGRCLPYTGGKVIPRARRARYSLAFSKRCLLFIIDCSYAQMMCDRSRRTKYDSFAQSSQRITTNLCCGSLLSVSLHCSPPRVTHGLACQTYADDTDDELVADAIRAIGYCARLIPDSTQQCLTALMSFIQSKYGLHISLKL